LPKNGQDTNRYYDHNENIDFDLKTELSINDLNQTQNLDHQSMNPHTRSHLKINLSKI